MLTPTQFLETMTALSGRFRFRVTSYYRSPHSNTNTGGVPGSLHQYWLAMDIVLENADHTLDFLTTAQRLGLVAIDEVSHIHVQAP